MKPFNNSRSRKSGVALLLVLFSTLLISIVMIQLSYTGNIDSKINRGNQHRLQSYYLAQSAARMGLLRIHMYKELEKILSSQASLAALVPTNLRSLIWGFPLPTFPLDPSTSEAPGTFTVIIKGEGSKLPINLLDGELHRMPPSVPTVEAAKQQADSVRNQIQTLIDLRAEDDSAFKDKVDHSVPGAYVDSIVDWIDTNRQGVQGGDEDSAYEQKVPPYKSRNDRFGALSEVSMIDLWDDDVFRPFKTEFSMINLKAKINCNTLSLARFKAYSKNLLTDEDLSLIGKHRLETPFSSLQDCKTFITTNPDMSSAAQGFTFPPEIEKDLKNNGYDRESSFLVEGSGNVNESRSLVRLYVRIDEVAPAPAANPNPQPGQPGVTTPTPETQFGEVRVIRFEEGAAQ